MPMPCLWIHCLSISLSLLSIHSITACFVSSADMASGGFGPFALYDTLSRAMLTAWQNRQTTPLKDGLAACASERPAAPIDLLRVRLSVCASASFCMHIANNTRLCDTHVPERCCIPKVCWYSSVEDCVALDVQLLPTHRRFSLHSSDTEVQQVLMPGRAQHYAPHAC